MAEYKPNPAYTWSAGYVCYKVNMKIKIPDWIFIDSEKGEVFCKRCGEREEPKLPMPIDAFIKWSQYFGEKHKYCTYSIDENMAEYYEK